MAPALLLVLVLYGVSGYDSVRQKLDLIQKEQLRPGAQVSLTAGELTAYVEHELRTAGPAGVREPRLELGAGMASGSAFIDFGKVRRAQGHPPGWLMSKLLDGERPVRVTARIRSAGGRATVDVERVEVSGVAIEGRLLDFLIQNYLMPNYPDAKVGQPFQLGYRIDRLDVKPGTVGVIIGK